MAIALVQVNYNGAGSGLTTTLNLTAGTPFTAGNCLIAFGGWGHASGPPTITTTGGTGSDTFTRVYFGGPDSTSGAATDYGIFILPSVGAGRTGIHVNYPSTPTSGFGDITVHEVSGLSNGVLDQVQFATNQGTASFYVTGNTSTLSSASEFCIAYCIGTGATGAASSPWTDLGQTIPGTAARSAYQIVSATTPISASFSRSSNTNGFVYCATFMTATVTPSQGSAIGTGAASAAAANRISQGAASATGAAAAISLSKGAAAGTGAANAAAANRISQGAASGIGAASASPGAGIAKGTASGVGAAFGQVASFISQGAASGTSTAFGAGFNATPPITLVQRAAAAGTAAGYNVPDIRLVQNNIFPQYSVTVDWSLLPDGTLDDTQALATAVIVALGTNALAGVDDLLPDPDSSNRCGWWGDLDAGLIWNGWPIGSKLWLLQRSKIVPAGQGQASTQLLVENYIRDAIQPFVDRKICSGFNVWTTRVDKQRIDALIRIYRGPEREIDLRYAVIWDAMVR